MKAFIYDRYGPPEALRLAEVDTPAPAAGEVLVKVRAASVNAADWHVMRGKPLFSRATLGVAAAQAQDPRRGHRRAGRGGRRRRHRVQAGR